jgi:hypothetical protein
MSEETLNGIWHELNFHDHEMCPPKKKWLFSSESESPTESIRSSKRVSISFEHSFYFEVNVNTKKDFLDSANQVQKTNSTLEIWAIALSDLASLGRDFYWTSTEELKQYLDVVEDLERRLNIEEAFFAVGEVIFFQSEEEEKFFSSNDAADGRVKIIHKKKSSISIPWDDYTDKATMMFSSGYINTNEFPTFSIYGGNQKPQPSVFQTDISAQDFEEFIKSLGETLKTVVQTRTFPWDEAADFFAARGQLTSTSFETSDILADTQLGAPIPKPLRATTVKENSSPDDWDKTIFVFGRNVYWAVREWRDETLEGWSRESYFLEIKDTSDIRTRLGIEGSQSIDDWIMGSFGRRVGELFEIIKSRASGCYAIMPRDPLAGDPWSFQIHASSKGLYLYQPDRESQVIERDKLGPLFSETHCESAIEFAKRVTNGNLSFSEVGEVFDKYGSKFFSW